MTCTLSEVVHYRHFLSPFVKRKLMQSDKVASLSRANRRKSLMLRTRRTLWSIQGLPVGNISFTSSFDHLLKGSPTQQLQMKDAYLQAQRKVTKVTYLSIRFSATYPQYGIDHLFHSDCHFVFVLFFFFFFLSSLDPRLQLARFAWLSLLCLARCPIRGCCFHWHRRRRRGVGVGIGVVYQ